MQKGSIIVILLHLLLPSIAQKKNWQNFDLSVDSVFGISTEKAYKTLLVNKKASCVIVAVIDSGIDTAQEDLRFSLWSNSKDGSHGRNFMGFEIGKEDVTNLASLRKEFYDSLSYTMVPETYRSGYQTFRKISKDYQGHIEDKLAFLMKLKESETIMCNIITKIGKDNPELDDFKSYTAKDDKEGDVVKIIIKKLPYYDGFADLKKHELDNLLTMTQYHLDHGLSMQDTGMEMEAYQSNDIRDVENDGVGLISDPNYTPYHGTHVSGIIGAERNNGIGIDGIADHVKIMMLKVINNVRELRDNDLASAIRYAADHGAKVINLSFGKPYTWNKKVVDAAVQYAMIKDIIIIHAAGNSGDNLDILEHYPNPIYADKKGIARAWIEVGASGWKDDSTLAASFSNYGKTNVDVFAPGMGIYSTLPFNQYIGWDGTSMAAPVVAGLAALIREYYPKLTAIQVKDIIMRSAIKVNHEVKVGKHRLP